MISDGIAKATRHKHLQTLLNLTRFLGNDWDNATKNDIENIIVKITNLYSDDEAKKLIPHMITKKCSRWPYHFSTVFLSWVFL